MKIHKGEGTYVQESVIEQASNPAYFYATMWLIGAIASLGRILRDSDTIDRRRTLGNALCGGFLAVGLMGFVVADRGCDHYWDLGIFYSVGAGLFPWVVSEAWTKGLPAVAKIGSIVTKLSVSQEKSEDKNQDDPK